jgi:hypothetical protein
LVVLVLEHFCCPISWLVVGFCVSRIYLMTDPAGAGIYANIGGILMGSMLPYMAYILWVWEKHPN